MNNELALQFTTQELSFLGSLFQPPIDFFNSEAEAEDPTVQAEAHQAAQLSLAEKNYLRPATSDEELILDVTVAAVIGVVGDPQSALVVSAFREKAVDPEQWQLCAARGLLVDQQEDSAGLHILTACRTRDLALQRLLDFLGLRQQPAAHNEFVRLAATDMAQVPYIIAGNGYEAGAAFLREAGAPDKAAVRLAGALDNPVRQSLIRAFTWQDGKPWEVGRLTLLEEIYGLWLIVPTEEDSDILAVTPVSAAEAAGRLRELADIFVQ